MDLPRSLGNFTLLKKLASGATADTYLARRTEDDAGREIVIKSIHLELTRDAKVVSAFKQEIAVAATLVHKNIVRAIEYGEISVVEHFLATEFIWGEDLRRIGERGMTAGRFIPLRLAVHVAAEVAEGLAYLHDKKDAKGQALNLIHRNPSPANIVVGFRGDVKLINFGVAQVEQQALDAMRTGRLKDKYAYLSPEQIEGGEADSRADVFVLGIVLYEFTTRKRLFKGRDDVSTRKLVSEAHVPPPSESIPSFPLELERIILKALARDRKDRYDNVRDMQAELINFNESRAGGAVKSNEVSDYLRSIFPDHIEEFEALLGVGYSGPKEVARTLGAISGAMPAVGASKARRSPTGSLPALPPLSQALAPPSMRDSVATPAVAEPSPEPADEPDEEFAPPGFGVVDDAPTTLFAREDDAVEEEPIDDIPEMSFDQVDAALQTSHQTADFRPAVEVEEPEPALSVEKYEDLGAVAQEMAAGAPASVGGIEVREAVVTNKPNDGVVYTFSHTLRQGHLDEFQKAAGLSTLLTRGFIVLLIAGIGVLTYYGIFHARWPWEEDRNRTYDIGDIGELPPLEMPATVDIRVESDPPAAVSVNGAIQALETPATVRVVAGMPNTFVFLADGFNTRVVNIDIPEDGPFDTVSATLEPFVQPLDWLPPEQDPDSDMLLTPEELLWHAPIGRINVTTEPPAATILLNGREVCVAPCEFDCMGETEQHITARKDGFLDTVAIVIPWEWEAPEDTFWLGPSPAFELRQDRGPGRRYTSLFLYPSPRDAQIFLDGDGLGTAIIHNYDHPMDEMLIVRLESEGFHPWQRTLYPEPGRFHLRSARMEEIYVEPGMLTVRIIQIPETLEEDFVQRLSIALVEIPQEIGRNGIAEYYELNSGTHTLRLSGTPPDGDRFRGNFTVEIPAGVHIQQTYVARRSRFELVESIEGPMPLPEEIPEDAQR